MLGDAVLEIVMILDERKRERKPKSLYLAEYTGPVGCSEPGIKHRLKVFMVICGSLFKYESSGGPECGTFSSSMIIEKAWSLL